MELREQILELMRNNPEPMNASQVQKALDVDKKLIDKAFAELKKSEEIISPVRCKWTVK